MACLELGQEEHAHIDCDLDEPHLEQSDPLVPTLKNSNFPEHVPDTLPVPITC